METVQVPAEIRLRIFLEARGIPPFVINKFIKDIERIRTNYFERRNNERSTKKRNNKDSTGKS